MGKSIPGRASNVPRRFGAVCEAVVTDQGTRSPTGMSRKQRGVTRDLLSAASARLFMLPLGAVAAILTTRLINQALGPQSFAVYALVAGVPLLFTYADLGLGAAIANSASTAAEDPVRFLAILRRSLLITFAVAFLIATASVFIGFAGRWSILLGVSDRGLNTPISLAMIVFAFSIPGGLGKSILLGIGRYGPSIIIQGVTPIFSLAAVALAVRLGAGTEGIVAVSSLGIFVVNWIGFVFAVVSMPGTWADFCRKSQTRVMGEVIRTAMPMLALMAGAGVLHQSGRLVLAHTSTLQQVAVYAALWTFFQPLWSIIQTAGAALWPRFAAARAAGVSSGREFRAATLTSALIGLLAGIGLALLGPLAVEIATAGEIEVDFAQCAILGAVLVVQAVILPAAMVLTFPRGLWLQSLATWCAAIIAVTIGAVLSAALGATAPMLGLLVAISIGQGLPIIISAVFFLKDRN